MPYALVSTEFFKLQTFIILNARHIFSPSHFPIHKVLTVLFPSIEKSEIVDKAEVIMNQAKPRVIDGSLHGIRIPVKSDQSTLVTKP